MSIFKKNILVNSETSGKRLVSKTFYLGYIKTFRLLDFDSVILGRKLSKIVELEWLS